MRITRNQVRLLKTAQGKLGLADDVYRSCLVRIAGVESSTGLDRDGFEAVLGHVDHPGFRPLVPRGPTHGARPGFATPARVQLIREPWREYTRDAEETALNRWLFRCWKVSSLRFLSQDDARKAITALKAMKTRAACVALRRPGPAERRPF